MTCIRTCPTPLGTVTLAGEGAELTGLWFEGQRHCAATLPADAAPGPLPVLDETCRWLECYFGLRPLPPLPPLRPAGTAFQRAVWALLLEIPYGGTVTYGELARRLAGRMGRSSLSAQAVGGAVGRNPISILIPCHRVLGSDGSLTGYAGGLERKAKLLTLEREGTACHFR